MNCSTECTRTKHAKCIRELDDICRLATETAGNTNSSIFSRNLGLSLSQRLVASLMGVGTNCFKKITLPMTGIVLSFRILLNWSENTFIASAYPVEVACWIHSVERALRLSNARS